MTNILQNADALRQAQKYEEAARFYFEVLRAEPRNFDALYAFGLLHLECSQFDGAADLIAKALAVNPEFVEGHIAHGMTLIQLQRHDEAIACFDRALDLRPNFVDALCNRATALLAMQRFDEALAGFDAALALDSNHIISLNNRGNTLAQMKRFEEAVESYDRALAIDADMLQARDNRMNALFELKLTKRCPPAFLRVLFDEFSTHYDETMVQKLGYRAHLHLRNLADRILPADGGPWRMLDLGCGTGLVGEAFKDLARDGRLDGIDLAPRMIEASRARGIYTDLILGDLETFLAEPGRSYNLILAADTMIYLGDLAPTFSGVASRLDPGGFYIFAVESTENETWQQTKANRFRHSESYLRNEAARAGLDFVAVAECILRSEDSVPVAGMAVALRKPAE